LNAAIHRFAARLILSLLALLLTACATPPEGESAVAAESTASGQWRGDHYGNARAELVAGIDGDTFRARIPGWPDIIGRDIRVRLAGVDTPELRARCDAELQAARAARDFANARLRAARQIELRHIRRGNYFRLVAEVWLDGRQLAAELIAAGLGRAYDGGRRGGWCG